MEGLICERLLVVYDEKDGEVGPLYLLVNKRWHRFYLDAGILFWQEGEAPDAEEDLSEGEVYLDLANELCALGVKINMVDFGDCELLVEFENQARFRIYSTVRADTNRFLERSAGSDSGVGRAGGDRP